MTRQSGNNISTLVALRAWLVAAVVVCCAAVWLPMSAQEPLVQSAPVELPDSLDMVNGAIEEIEVGADEDEAETEATTEAVPLHRQRIEFDEAYDAELRLDSIAAETGERVQVFNPDATRAVWLSALCPGLGQLYNRRYWKLPIVVGAYMGLAYATSWNNSMLTDYTKAYRDLIDNDPDTKSYMDFFAPNVQESSLSKSWLENLFSSRKNYFRRNRDLCIISMVGVYLLAMVDAYVDASLAHFDISPDLTLDWSPMIVPETRSGVPSVGIQWALTF